jgi:hypothetical protein
MPVQSASCSGHIKRFVRRLAQGLRGYRPPDRTRDAIDKAPPELRSHGFCDARLYNNERLHQALG